MKNLIAWILIAGCMSAMASGDGQPQSPVHIDSGDVPIGALGVPLGQLVLLEGTRVDGMKTGIRTLKIDKIDGKAAVSPRAIWIDNVDLPKNTRCILRGYETMEMIGDPPAYQELARLEKQPPSTSPQAGWQVSCYFMALEVVEPNSLKIRNPDGLAGPAAPQGIDVQSLGGPLDEVVKINHLDEYHSWPMMNLPPQDDSGTIYFLDHGDLVLRYHGNPPSVRSAEFRPSDQSAQERFQQANTAWDQWVKAHSGPKAAK